MTCSRRLSVSTTGMQRQLPYDCCPDSCNLGGIGNNQKWLGKNGVTKSCQILLYLWGHGCWIFFGKFWKFPPFSIQNELAKQNPPKCFPSIFAKASNFYPFFIIIKEEHLPCTDAGALGAPSANAVCCRAVLTHHFTEEVRQLVDNRMFPQNPSQKGEVADFRRVLFCSLNSTLFCFSNAQEKASHAMG